MRYIVALSSLAGCLGLVCVAMAATSESAWPTFRGANRSGVSQETGLLKEWPSGGPELVWKAAGAGRGYASVAVVGDKVFTLGDAPSTAKDKDEYIVAFDRSTGKQAWMCKTGSAWNSGQESWQSSRSTPTVDGDKVYVISPHGNLVCCSASDGKELWRKDLKKDFDGKKADGWGYSESVTIDGDHLLCTPGGDKNTMVALNKATGELIWSCRRPGDAGAGHASIVMSKIGETNVLVQTTGSGAMGVRASDGKLLWTFNYDKVTAAIPTPLVRDNLVFIDVGYKHGGALLKQIPDGKDGVKIETIYGLQLPLSNKHGGLVLVGDYVYGDTEDSGQPFCASLLTGEVKWKSRGSGKGSAAMFAAEGNLYIHYADGKVVLAKASPDEYKEISSFKAPGSGERPSWSYPVIVDGKLYIREQDTLLCYNVKAK